MRKKCVYEYIDIYVCVRVREREVPGGQRLCLV